MFNRSTTIAHTDPALWAAIQAEHPAPGRPHRADRQRKLRPRPPSWPPGTQLTNKYAEGYPGKPLLRRLRARRRGPSSWPSTASSSCLAPSANVQPHLRRQRQHRCFLAFLEARRHHHGHEPGEAAT